MREDFMKFVESVTRDVVNSLLDEARPEVHHPHPHHPVEEDYCDGNCDCCEYHYEEDDYIGITDLIDRVIAQGTAVVVLWKDGNKTVAKCNPEDKYDYEKGLSMAILKYVFGNRAYRDMVKIMDRFPKND